VSSSISYSASTDYSPDIIERIESFLSEDGRKALEINQVLINEYQADQGISVCPFLLEVLHNRASRVDNSHTKMVLHSNPSSAHSHSDRTQY
jgi:hypothetical protein